ncbi:MAG: FAD-binding protein [Acidobacteria bacterium]|nr:FAD-binding protein [Acidobacteriota bacterium]
MTARIEPSPALFSALRALLGERFSVSPYDIESHARDESWHEPEPPDGVAFVESTEEAAAVVRLCAEHHTPIVPFGAGTSVEGHVQAVRGGVSLDLSRMKAILSIEPDDLDCRVQAGVTRMQLNRELEKQGLMFPVDPGADATLGGMAATGASGTTTVRYGAMRENVLGLTVVTADGRIVKTGGRARKSSSGYDLTRLFVGSEGTLGVITELQLRLQPLPEAVSSAVCAFESLDGAVDCVVEALQSAIPVARCELLDEASIDAVNGYSKLDLPRAPTLFLEFHGTQSSVAEQAELSRAIAAQHGGGEFRWSARREDRDKLWEARHKAYYALKALRPGARGWPTDVVVPISKLAECIRETVADCGSLGLLAPVLGHVGDGNFHVAFLFDEGDAEELGRVREANRRLIARALAMGGACTGEHGVGLGKIEALEAEHGEGVELMRKIKQALDPEGLLNPGKVFRD